MKKNLYIINILSKNIEEIDKKYKKDFLMTDHEGLELLSTFFDIIKNEMTEIAIQNEHNSEQSFYGNIKILINHIKAEKINSQKLEEQIKKKIDRLKKLIFYKGFRPIKPEELIEKLNSIRLHRIKLWKNLLEEFRVNKSAYLKELNRK